MSHPTFPFRTGMACIGLTLVGSFIIYAETPRSKATPASSTAPAKPLIDVSKETTHFTAPLDSEGYLDCIGALNAHYGKGVSLSENAAELIIEAVGAADHSDDVMNKVRASLGMPPLNGGGKYLVTTTAYGKESLPDGVSVEATNKAHEALREELFAAQKQPWSEQEFPRIAALLSRNAEPLALVHQAVERPKYFRPFALQKPGLTMMSVLLPDIQVHREIACQLEARAMQHMHAGRLDEAQQDLYDMHRLASCSARGMSIVEGLVGIAIDAIASHGDNVWATQPGVTAEQLATYREQLAALPPVTNLIDRTNNVERLFLVDVIQHIARGKLQSDESRAMFGAPEDAQKARSMFDPGQLMQAISLLSVDWNTALIESNKFYDDVVTAGSVSDRTERLALFNEWETRLKQEKARIAGRGGAEGAALAAIRFTFASSTSRGRDMAGMLSTLLLPAVHKASAAEESGKMRIEMTQLALALAEYRLHEGMYPEQLSDIPAAMVESIPDDIFSGKALRYASDGASYKLYSIGRNEKDDGGVPGEGKDDIIVSDPVLP